MPAFARATVVVLLAGVIAATVAQAAPPAGETPSRPPRVRPARPPAGVTGEATTAWALAPDPIAEPFSNPRPVNTQVRTSYSAAVLPGGQPGRFVGIVSNDMLTFLDLKTGGTAAGPKLDSTTDRIIGDDGDTIAAATLKSPYPLVVYAIKAQKQLASIAPNGKGFGPKPFLFLSKDRILIHDWGTMRVWDLTKPAEESSFSAGGHPSRENVAATPGGKFVAVANSDKVAFFDTATGNPAGKLALANTPKRFAAGADNASFYSIKTLAFSPDGAVLALLGTSGDVARVALVDVKTGAVTDDHAFPCKATGAVPLSFSPDSARILVGGTVVVDRSTLAPIFTLAAAKDLLYAQFLDADSVVTFARGDKSVTVATTKLDKAQIAKAVEIVKAGGKAEDAVLGKALAADAGTAKPLAIEAAPVDKGAVIARPPAAKHVNGPFAVRQPPAGFNARTTVEGFFPSSVTAGSFLVDHAATGTSSGQRESGWIARYDTSGVSTAAALVPATAEPLDLSPAGTHVLFRAGEQRDRIDVMALDRTGALTPAGAFRPYAAAAAGRAPVGRRFGGSGNSPIAAAAFVDETRVMTVEAQTHVATLWDVTTGKAVWTATLSAPDFAFTADRKVLALPTVWGVALVEPLAGKVLGGFRITEGDIRDMAFRADAAQLAVLTGTEVATVTLFDVAKGTEIAAIPFPGRGGRIQFVSDKFLLAGGTLLSVEKKCPVWQYNFTAARRQGHVHPYDTPVAFATGNTGGIIAAPQVPSAAAVRALAAIDPADLYIWQPGMKVALTVNAVGGEPHTKQAYDSYKRSLEALGFVIDPAAPNALNASAGVVNGEAITYRSFGGGGNVSYTPKALSWNITLTIKGQQAWSSTSGNMTPGGGGSTIFLDIRKGESAQQALDRMYPPPTGCPVYVPPAYILKAGNMGSSSLTNRGAWDDRR